MECGRKLEPSEESYAVTGRSRKLYTCSNQDSGWNLGGCSPEAATITCCTTLNMKGHIFFGRLKKWKIMSKYPTSIFRRKCDSQNVGDKRKGTVRELQIRIQY